MEIKNVIITGLGALGLTYANKLMTCCDLKILVDKKRYDKYTDNPPLLNHKKMYLDYIMADEKFDADFILITTKMNGLNSALDNIKNFVSDNTIIITLINGISSEKIIAEKYGNDKVLNSYFIGHSAVREDAKNLSIIQDGTGTIVFGSKDDETKNKEQQLKHFFEKNNIDYKIPDDIIYSQWTKLGVNICLNELSAIYKLNMGDLKKHHDFYKISDCLLDEIQQIANSYGIKNLDNYKKDVLELIDKVNDEGKTSMLQDILYKRKTEIDIFSGEIIKLGKIYNIKTPYNDMMYNKIKEIEVAL